MSQDNIKFPKTFNINSLIEVAETKSDALSYEVVINPNETLKFDDERINYFNIVKNISIEIKGSSEVKVISLCINDKIIEKSYSEDNNREIFKFKIFNINGVVQNPKLFTLNFTCDPKPLRPLNATIHYHYIKVDEQMDNFLRYNHYYSVHLIAKQILSIYYCPNKIEATYNARFIEINDVSEFNSVIDLEYEWVCPTIYSFKLKKEKHRIISVEVSNEMEKLMDEDPLLKIESTRTVLGENLVNKCYIVHMSQKINIESHLLSEYGLISYVTIHKIPKSQIDDISMKKITDDQKSVLKRLMQTNIKI